MAQGEFSMFESRITTKGQTTLPKPVRDSLEVKPGDKVRYVIIDEGVNNDIYNGR